MNESDQVIERSRDQVSEAAGIEESDSITKPALSEVEGTAGHEEEEATVEVRTPEPDPLNPGILEPEPQSLASTPDSPVDSTTKPPGHEEEETAAEVVDRDIDPEPLDPGTLEPATSTPDSPLSTPPAAPLPPAQVIEALLFAADAPVKLDRLAELAETTPESARSVIDELNATYQETGRIFRIQRVAQGFQLYTMPEYAEFVRRLYQHQYTHRLSRAALEVMAIIAYKQPVTRPEVEQLRGVDCSGPLVTLLERRLIATYGRASRPGNPFLYRTTPEFLRYFGLAGLEDLPRMEEIGEFLARRETGPDGNEPGKNETFDSLAMDGGHRDGAPEDAR
jgi:segregation and condensation protein B